jgi:hypothetical protein
LKTLEVTLGNGIAWSDSPTSAATTSEMEALKGETNTFEHVTDENRALDNISVAIEGLAVAGGDENHDR